MSLITYYIPLMVLGVVCMGFAPLAWFVSRFIRPTKTTPWMESTYECGSEPIGDAHVQFRFQYYAFAIIFVVFDLVATILMVWAVGFSGLSTMARIWVLIFLGVIILGVSYALKKEEVIWI